MIESCNHNNEKYNKSCSINLYSTNFWGIIPSSLPSERIFPVKSACFFLRFILTDVSSMGIFCGGGCVFCGFELLGSGWDIVIGVNCQLAKNGLVVTEIFNFVHSNSKINFFLDSDPSITEHWLFRNFEKREFQIERRNFFQVNYFSIHVKFFNDIRYLPA